MFAILQLTLLHLLALILVSSGAYTPEFSTKPSDNSAK